MPAAAVIPAPIAYINVVVVKKLVVGSRRAAGWSALLQPLSGRGLSRDRFARVTHFCWFSGPVTLTGRRCLGQQFYFEKIRVLKAGF